MTSIESTNPLDLAYEAGSILLENGAEISRVEETMRRIASHYGVEDESFFVLSNGIMATGKTMPAPSSSLSKGRASTRWWPSTSCLARWRKGNAPWSNWSNGSKISAP